jgi:hypothetical protein
MISELDRISVPHKDIDKLLINYKFKGLAILL